jgi:hypothetical protein
LSVIWKSSVPRQSVASQWSLALTVVDPPLCGMKLSFANKVLEKSFLSYDSRNAEREVH